ncbi:diguanylate cyclase (GGDEF) domain-containing protein [Franzmannia pantelleriensis]|uniref:diguanylate cyclase n=1 Tax=Franzmannia pantelleriensis TaxID=48727 RepID=A0A1G9M3Y6_9GAMM|nr:diguanylate cyclase [Halomonas pantelleriensis]SDL68979.1 diguanylate cyclase (GGDEF) domain-containing protein [Halomonas pantelleriensis]
MPRTFASLRLRFLLALGGVLCLALLALVLVARYQIMPILLEDEEQFAGSELDRAERAIGSELGHMRRVVEDWAWWDDTYQFVLGERPEYVDSNLYQSTLETLDLKMMIFFDAQHRPVWVAGFDEDGEFTSCNGSKTPCHWVVSYIDAMQSKLERQSDETQTWLLASPDMAMASMSGIYRSHETSPSAGSLLMVRPLSTSWIEQLRDTTGIELDVNSVSNSNADANDNLRRVSSTRMAASRTLDAMPDDHLIRVDALLPRQRYQASLETFRFALYWTSGVLIVTLLIVLWLLESIVLAPIRQLSRFTQRVHLEAAPPPMPAHLLARRDEIGTLAQEFRDLVDHHYQQSSLLLELSQHDSLTGLANRRLFDQRLEQALHSAQASGHQVSALMIDIDHFKLYNDYYGHLAGDDCLIALAECMQQHLGGKRILAARTGGEEFSVLMPDTSLQAAMLQAESLRLAIEARALPHATSPTAPHLTVSIGVASCHPTGLDDAVSLMQAADQALYRAKESGRNRVATIPGHRHATTTAPSQ